VQTVSYQLEYGRTEAQPAIFCALQNLCLPEARDPFLRTRLLAVAGWQVSQDWSDDPQYPTHGGVGRLELRHASSAIGSDATAQFSKGTADVAWYFGLGNRLVLTPRVRVGAVVGPSFTATSTSIPQQERLFAGGGQTVRGFDQNDLGPKVYIAPSYDTVQTSGTVVHAINPGDTVYFRVRPGTNSERSVPTGGSALAVTNLELRWLASRHIQLSAFVDAGELWTPGALEPQDQFRNLKFTPGVGIRFATPVGLLGVDVAYNSYAPRAGAAFFDTPIKDGGQLYCVSPGNALPVTLASAGGQVVQSDGACPRNFQPPTVTGFLRRLNVIFGIGQAY
jgi:outer membrane protein insertion porin family/translocation and assembly module TamA